MEYVIFSAIVIFYLYRTFSQAQKRAKQEAERRQRSNEQVPREQSANPKQKTLEDVLTEVFREVENKSKPFGEKLPVPQRSTRREKDKRALQAPAAKPKPTKPKKKEPAPFLTTDYTPETVEPEGTPSTSMQDFIKKSQLTDAYAQDRKETARVKFKLRDAVIAKIILDRPQW